MSTTYGSLERLIDLNRDVQAKHSEWSRHTGHGHHEPHHKNLRFYINEYDLRDRGLIVPTPILTVDSELELTNFTIEAQDGSKNVSYAIDGIAGIAFRDTITAGALEGKTFYPFKFDVSQYDNITGFQGIPKCISLLFNERLPIHSS